MYMFSVCCKLSHCGLTHAVLDLLSLLEPLQIFNRFCKQALYLSDYETQNSNEEF
jgi:hypothetical protein